MELFNQTRLVLIKPESIAKVSTAWTRTLSPARYRANMRAADYALEFGRKRQHVRASLSPRNAKRYCWHAAQGFMHAVEISICKNGRGRFSSRPLYFFSAMLRHFLRRLMSAALIGCSGSSAFRLSTTTAMSMSPAGSCFSSESAPGPFHHGIRDRGGTILWAALPSG